MVLGEGWNRKDAAWRKKSIMVQRRKADMMGETRKVEIKISSGELGRWLRG